MNKLMQRAQFAVSNERGASNLEIIVWMSVVLVIAGFLFAFRNKIGTFINSVTGKVGSMQTTMDSSFSTGDANAPTPTF